LKRPNSSKKLRINQKFEDFFYGKTSLNFVKKIDPTRQMKSSKTLFTTIGTSLLLGAADRLTGPLIEY
jgi:hypothetical protein